MFWSFVLLLSMILVHSYCFSCFLFLMSYCHIILFIRSFHLLHPLVSTYCRPFNAIVTFSLFIVILISSYSCLMYFFLFSATISFFFYFLWQLVFIFSSITPTIISLYFYGLISCIFLSPCFFSPSISIRFLAGPFGNTLLACQHVSDSRLYFHYIYKSIFRCRLRMMRILSVYIFGDYNSIYT